MKKIIGETLKQLVETSVCIVKYFGTNGTNISVEMYGL